MFGRSVFAASRSSKVSIGNALMSQANQSQKNILYIYFGFIKVFQDWQNYSPRDYT